MDPFIRAEEGQSLILIAAGFAMLLGAVAFSVDWGYAYAQHRALSNAAQAGALAAGRLLSASVIKADDPPGCTTTCGYGFPGASEESVYAEACRFALRNLGSPTASSTYALSLEFWRWSAPVPPATQPTQSFIVAKTSTSPFTIANGTGNLCNVPGGVANGKPAASNALPPVPNGSSLDVRVVPSVSYQAIFSAASSSVATARARIGGGKLTFSDLWGGGTPWATVSRYIPGQLQNGLCSGSCDPSQVSPVTFWSSGVKYGQFKGLIDFSRNSTEPNATDMQLLTAWDQSGSQYASPATAFKSDWTGKCSQSGVPGGKWDTSGNDGNDKQCSIPNWTYHGFAGYFGIGTQALSTDWGSAAVLNQSCPVVPCREAPSDIGGRPSICPLPPDLGAFLVAPSCTSHSRGDWVETNTSGDVGSNMASALCAVFRAPESQPWVQTNDFSSKPLPNGTNSACPNGGGYVSGTYGRALVVAAYLWDCAESYDKSKTVGNRWSLIVGPGGDCANVADWTGNPTPERVHLFTIAPFTFYEGLIGSTEVKGFWGGAFASPDTCSMSNCALNQFTNTTWLVGDEGN